MSVIQERRFDYKGYPCVILYHATGYRCGYVGVPNDRKYDIDNIYCHGGITYHDNYLRFQKDTDKQWIGFNTMHYGDAKDFETDENLFEGDKDTLKTIEFYKGLAKFYGNAFPTPNLEYCMNECKNIVEQIIEMRNE